MAKRSKSIFLLLQVLMLAAACSKEPGQAEASATAPTATPTGESVLQLDITAHKVSVTHRPTGQTHLLFEDKTLEGSEQGTFHQLLSSFGPYVSYSNEWYYEGGAHPSYGETYNAVYVGEALEVADLRSLFPERIIYAALQQTVLVQKAPLAHTNLNELIDGLATTYQCEMSFDRFFSSFFVKDIQGDTVEIIVGLTHGCEVARGNFTTITLKMNVSEDKKVMFADLQVFKRE